MTHFMVMHFKGPSGPLSFLFLAFDYIFPQKLFNLLSISYPDDLTLKKHNIKAESQLQWQHDLKEQDPMKS